jgi:replication factor C subunit 1
LTEDQFLDLIATRKGAKPDEKQIKAMQKEEKKIQDAAKEMEKKEKEDEKLRKRKEAALVDTGMAAKYVLNSDFADMQEGRACFKSIVDHKVCSYKPQGGLW